MNDTRVSALRLFGKKINGGVEGAQIEALLLSEIGPGRFEALVKPGKRLRTGSRVLFEDGLIASVDQELADGIRLLDFGQTANLGERLQAVGVVPLPPYIHEALRNPERYQTVYASHNGSAAAPTAGLHFTPEILSALKANGVQVAYVTLHVGLDTFRPVAEEDPAKHTMHGEVCTIPPETAESIADAKGRIIAVGTTTVRTLETMAFERRRVRVGSQTSKLFIRPRFEFLVVDGMFTNFHLPKTTMLMMVSALAGRENVLRSYAHAVQQNYRFLSFGDSMLVI